MAYSALWYPEVFTYESFAMGGFLLHHTEKLTICSGIANIYARDPWPQSRASTSLSRMSGGRFVLGLGVSHVPLVQDARGHELPADRSPRCAGYLDALDRVQLQPALEHDAPVVLAALGPKMLELAGKPHARRIPIQHHAGTYRAGAPNHRAETSASS